MDKKKQVKLSMQINDKIRFGIYDWRVLDVQSDAALILTEDIIEHRAYHDAYKDITWADCALRNYLNGEFCDKFAETEQRRIMPVVNKNAGNPWHDTPGGTDTRDKIFLLSLEEAVCHYFSDSGANLRNRSAKQNYWFQRKDPNNDKRRALFNGRETWYWLRSPGRVSKKAVYIHGDGNIGIQGNNIFIGNVDDFYHEGVKYRGGVRPALWLKL